MNIQDIVGLMRVLLDAAIALNSGHITSEQYNEIVTLAGVPVTNVTPRTAQSGRE